MFNQLMLKVNRNPRDPGDGQNSKLIFFKTGYARVPKNYPEYPGGMMNWKP